MTRHIAELLIVTLSLSWTTRASPDPFEIVYPADLYGPVIYTWPATDVTGTTAYLRGRVIEDWGLSCEYHFIYWPASDPNAAIETPWRCCVNKGQIFQEKIEGLSPSTTYFYRAQAQNSLGSGTGEDLAFTTLSGHALQISAGAGGIVETPGQGTFLYAHGTVVSILATPEPGYQFTNWSGTFWSASNPAQLTMESDHEIRANFKKSGPPGPRDLGFSLGEFAFDDLEQFNGLVRNNNFTHPRDSRYDRLHVQLVRRLLPDPAGMMRMRNLADLDPDSPTSGEVIHARAKAPFDKYTGGQVLVRFAYLFERSVAGLTMVAYLSDLPELPDRSSPSRAGHYIEIGRVPVPPEGRPGSVGSGRFGVFEAWVSTSGLKGSNGLWVELELMQARQRPGEGPSVRGIQLAAAADSEGGSALVDDCEVEVHCDGICLDLNWSDTADEEDFLLVIASTGHSAGLLDGGVGSRYCLDGAFSSEGYVDAYDIHAWDWALSDASRVAYNYCRVPLPLADAGSVPAGGRYLSPAAPGLQPAGFGSLPAELLILGKGWVTKSFSDLLMDRFSLFSDKPAYVADYTQAGLPSRCNVKVVRGPGDAVYAVNTEKGVLRIDGPIREAIPSRTITCSDDPRYHSSATVYIGIQGQGANSFGRPILDVAFSVDGDAYVVPVVVKPTNKEPYVAGARLQLQAGTDPPYRLVQLYDDPPLPGDNQRRDHPREIEVDGAGNVYMMNVHSLNESCILWRYAVDGAVLQRLDLTAPGSGVMVSDPIALHLARDGRALYLASGQRNPQSPNDAILYGLSTQDFTLLRSITIRDMQQVTSVTEDPATRTLWVAGFSMPEIPEYPSPMGTPFYVPNMASISSQAEAADAIRIPAPTNGLTLPTSILWTGESAR